MNPVTKALVERGARIAVLLVAGMLVEHNWLTQAEADTVAAKAMEYVLPAAMTAAVWAWGHRREIHERVKMVTGFAVGRPVTEQEVSEMVKQGVAADAKTPTTEVPVIPLDVSTLPRVS